MTITTHSIPTKEGNFLHVFYNDKLNLIVVDLIHKSEEYGNEIFRMTINETQLLSHQEKDYA